MKTIAKTASLVALLALAAADVNAMENSQMKRASINPVSWGEAFLLDQGEVTEGTTRVLRTSGQVAFKEDASSEFGVSITNEGDIRGQIQDTLANIDDVLKEAGMGRENVVHVRFFTTDIDGFMQNYDAYAAWIAPAGVRPPQSVLGVNRLVFPELLVEIEVTAAQ